MAGIGEGNADADTAAFDAESKGREVRSGGDGGTKAVVGQNGQDEFTLRFWFS